MDSLAPIQILSVVTWPFITLANSLAATVTDLDAKHSGKNSTHSSSENINESTGRGHLGSSNTPTTDTVSTPTPDSPPATIQEVTCTRGMQRSQSSGPPPSTQRHGPSPKASSPSLTRSSSAHTANSSSAPPRTTSPPLLTPTPTHTTSPQRPSLAVTAGIVRSKLTRRKRSARKPSFRPPTPSLYLALRFPSTLH